MAHSDKKIQLINFMTKRKKCEKEAAGIVVDLIEKGVSKEYLLDKAGLISPHHMDDVAEERKLVGICGWTLCDNPLVSIPKQQYVIRGNRVLDISERKNFCSSNCYTTWVHFRAQMMTSPLWLRDEELTPTFTIFEPELEKDLLHGILFKFEHVSLDDLKQDRDSDDDDDIEK